MSQDRSIGFRLGACLMVAAAIGMTGGARAEQAKHPGLEVVRAKCFQCHTDSMWRDARQDARWWEAAVYRMVGRGGIFTPGEIKTMTEYLAIDFGPNAKPPEPRK